MTKERMMELLNNVINNISVARSNYETIQKLLYIGFEQEELHEYFGFSLADIVDAEEGMESYIND